MLTRPALFRALAQLPLPPEDAPKVRCEHHSEHSTLSATIELPGLPKPLSLSIYDYRRYGHRGYEGEGFPYDWCTGQDVISYCIAEQGIWEPMETALVIDLLSRGNREDLVLDLGCHIGWYSLLAGALGYEVVGVDANDENRELAAINRLINELPPAQFIRGWIDGKAPILPVDQKSIELIHFVKIDIEGNENQAVTMLYDLFAESLIKYCLIEVSPVFAEYYPEMMEWIAKPRLRNQQQYRLYKVPPKDWEHLAEFTAAPLETLRRYCEIPSAEIRETVASWQQENVLCIAEDIDG